MEGPKPRSNRFWLILLGILLVAAVLGMAAVRSMQETGAVVQVLRGGQEVDSFPLSRDGVHRYENGKGGYNIVEVKDGKVSVTEASCPDQICVRHGPTDQTADPIVCLPNQLVVQVLSPEGGAGQLDGVSS